MQKIIDFLFYLGDLFLIGMRLIRESIHSFVTFYFAQVVIVLVTIKAFLVAMSNGLTVAYEKWIALNESAVVDGDMSAVGSTTLTIFETCNYIFPLEELFAFLVVYASLWLTAITYRFVKSWIPKFN